MQSFVLSEKWRSVFEWVDKLELQFGVKRRDFKRYPSLDKRMEQIIHDVAREPREAEVDKMLGEFCRLMSQRFELAAERRTDDKYSFRDAT